MASQPRPPIRTARLPRRPTIVAVSSVLKPSSGQGRELCLRRCRSRPVHARPSRTILTKKRKPTMRLAALSPSETRWARVRRIPTTMPTTFSRSEISWYRYSKPYLRPSRTDADRHRRSRPRHHHRLRSGGQCGQKIGYPDGTSTNLVYDEVDALKTASARVFFAPSDAGIAYDPIPSGVDVSDPDSMTKSRSSWLVSSSTNSNATALSRIKLPFGYHVEPASLSSRKLSGKYSSIGKLRARVAQASPTPPPASGTTSLPLYLRRQRLGG